MLEAMEDIRYLLRSGGFTFGGCAEGEGCAEGDGGCVEGAGGCAQYAGGREWCAMFV